MARNQQKPEPWFDEVAEIMVKEGLNFRRAAESIGIDLEPEEANRLQRLKSWEIAKLHAENRFYEELGGNPERTKNVLLGMIVHSMRKMVDESLWRDVVQAGLTLAKIEYGALSENQVSVLGSLSQSEIDKIKERLKGLQEASESIKSEIN